MVNETNKGYTRQILFNIYYNVVDNPETAPLFLFYYCLSEQSPVFYYVYQYTSLFFFVVQVFQNTNLLTY